MFSKNVGESSRVSDLTMETMMEMMRRLDLVEYGDMPEDWREIRLGERLYDVTREDWVKRAELYGVKVPALTSDETAIEIMDVKVVKDRSLPADKGYVTDQNGEVVALIVMKTEKEGDGVYEVVTGARELLEWKKIDRQGGGSCRREG